MTVNDLALPYSHEELAEMLGSVGDDVQVSGSVIFYSPRNIHIGSHVRIDSYSVLSASCGIVIGDHVHISTHCFLAGSSGKIHLESFSGLSSRTTIFTATDDYVEGFMSNPTVPSKYRKVSVGDVVLKRHALVGCGSVVLPGVTLGVGASVGALSLVNKNVPDFAIVSGVPIKTIGHRGRRLLELERTFLDEEASRPSADVTASDSYRVEL